MKVTIFGDPPRTPRVYAEIGDRSLEEVRKIIGGREALVPVLGEYAALLSVAELDALYDKAEECGVVVEDTRGRHMKVGHTSLEQEVAVVQ